MHPRSGIQFLNNFVGWIHGILWTYENMPCFVKNETLQFPFVEVNICWNPLRPSGSLSRFIYVPFIHCRRDPVLSVSNTSRPKARKKCSPFFQYEFNCKLTFVTENMWTLIEISLFVCFQLTIWQHCLGSGLTPNRPQDSVWTNVGQFSWRNYALLDFRNI